MCRVGRPALVAVMLFVGSVGTSLAQTPDWTHHEPLPAPSGPFPVGVTTVHGTLGHSLGGAAALEACVSQALLRACADMDGYPFGDVEQQGVGRPFLVLLSQPDRDNPLRHEIPPRPAHARSSAC